MINPKCIKVGDKFYFVGNSNAHDKGTVVVKSVGRKWVCLNSGARFDRTDAEYWRRLDRNGSTNSPGDLYDSKEQYEELVKKLRILHRIQDLRWYGSERRIMVVAMKLEDIQLAAKILGADHVRK